MRHYLAITRTSVTAVCMAATPRPTPGHEFVALLGPLTQAQAEWAARHPGEWLTVQDIQTRTGRRTVEMVRSGL